MVCGTCGGGDRWIKTCIRADGSRVRLCDACWKKLRSALVVVPGDEVVTARCELCGRYDNPRGFAEVRPGGRKDAYAGVCGNCSEGALMGAVQGPYLPPGYRLDESDPDLVALRRSDGTIVARFSAQGATREAIENEAWEDHRSEEE